MDRYYFEHLTSLREIATSAPSGPPRNDTVIWQLAASIQQSDKSQFVDDRNPIIHTLRIRCKKVSWPSPSDRIIFTAVVGFVHQLERQW